MVLESRSSRENAKRDWYIWRDQPNNWTSNFGGSAWEMDEKTGQYYCHSFLKAQPDLNWRNPEVVNAMFDVLRFWLKKGVDGFRVDVMWLMIKDDQFRDNPPNPGFRLGSPSNHRWLPVYNSDRPEVHAIVAEMRAVVDEYADRVLIGEIYLPLPQLMSYYGKDLCGVNLPFNFHLLLCPWTATAVAEVINAYNSALPVGAWPNWVLGNHDQPRIASRVGKDQARIAAMLLLTLPGTITMYYGDEIGMTNALIAPEQVQDPAEKNEPGVGQGRDPERTPMRWDASTNAGFTTASPWLPMGEDIEKTNVATQSKDDSSLLALYRRLILLRKSHPTLMYGRLHEIQVEGNVLRFRRSGAEELEVILNMGREEVIMPMPDGTILASTHEIPACMNSILRQSQGVILSPKLGTRA